MADTPRFNVLYMDMNSFFASVEQHLNPDLRGKVVGISALTQNAGSLVAASIEAKRYGIKTGTGVREARTIYPGIIILPSRHRIYVRHILQVVDILDRLADVERLRSVDEIQIRLSGETRTLAGAEGLVNEMRRHIAAGLGPALRFSAGVGPNHVLAKIGSKLRKPDGFSWLGPENMPHALAHWDLTDLPGIAGGVGRRLLKAGIKDIPALWALDPKQARRVWGSIEGERFVRALRGEAIPLLPTERGGYGSSKVLGPDAKGPAAAHLVGRWLVSKAARRMRRQGWATSLVTLQVTLGWHDPARPIWGWGKSMKTRHTQDSFLLLSIYEQLWSRMLVEAKPVVQVQSIHVHLGALERIERRPGDLLEEVGAGELTPRERASRIMDQINARYGAGTLTVGEERPHPGFFERG